MKWTSRQGHAVLVAAIALGAAVAGPSVVEAQTADLVAQGRQPRPQRPSPPLLPAAPWGGGCGAARGFGRAAYSGLAGRPLTPGAAPASVMIRA